MSRIRFSRKQLTLPYALFLLFFVVFPLLLIVYYAFTDNNGKLTLNNFVSFFSDNTKLRIYLKFLLLFLLYRDQYDFE
jgi:spermidine/putrescine transport system permease protein